MEYARIVIGMNSIASSGKLRSILTESGYTVVDQARDGHELLRKVRTIRPDIVILEYDLPLINGLEVSKIVTEDKICSVILILSNMQHSAADEIGDDYDFVCMTKPLNKSVMLNTIELLFRNNRKIRQLEKEIEDLKTTLETRKTIEKAKGLLMKHLKLSEPEAFKKIQKQSMDKGIPMRDIAKAIILAYDM